MSNRQTPSVEVLNLATTATKQNSFFLIKDETESHLDVFWYLPQHTVQYGEQCSQKQSHHSNPPQPF